MSSNILLSAADLHDLIQVGRCVVVDCRFALSDPEKGRADWLVAHIPGAGYAHLDDDVADSINEESGRHPLPDSAKFAEFLSSLGWSTDKLLVAYDDGSNAISGRLWWLMRYFGQSAALLDGGLAAARTVILTHWEGIIREKATSPGRLDYKTRLQEVLAAQARTPVYDVDGDGPDHDRVFAASVIVDGGIIGRGAGRSKKEAEQAAAMEALESLQGQ